MTLATRFFYALSVVWLFFTTTAEGAHSRRRTTSSAPSRRADVHYDRSITTFSKDGRLLQVEYGMRASKRGGPVAAFKTPDGESILVAVSSATGVGGVSNNDKVHRVDQHIFMAIAGLSGDGRLIAQQLRLFCQRHRLSHGEAPTVEEVAQEAAEMQHMMTRSPGNRPLGCTTIIWGADTSPSGKVGRKQLFRTDPGGIVEECAFAAAGRNEEDVLDELDKLAETARLDSAEARGVLLWSRFVATVLKKTTTDPTDDATQNEDPPKHGSDMPEERVDFWIMTTTNGELRVRRMEAITYTTLSAKLSLPG